MAGRHWTDPDIAAAILAEARRPDAAEPVAIHVRPEIHAVVRRRADVDATAPAGGDAGRWLGIPVVVDESIPEMPGYEIHRAVAPGRGHPAGIRPGNGRSRAVVTVAA